MFFCKAQQQQQDRICQYVEDNTLQLEELTLKTQKIEDMIEQIFNFYIKRDCENCIHENSPASYTIQKEN